MSRNSSSGEMRSSFIKRFSSFKRSGKSSKSSSSLLGRNKSGSSSGSRELGQTPAKFIQATAVQRATLSPRWNERFRFELDDVAADTLHVDIWDHDDEANVLEAVKKLNEVKGLKGKPLLSALFSAPVPGHSCTD
jgi:hypothetical protein